MSETAKRTGVSPRMISNQKALKESRYKVGGWRLTVERDDLLVDDPGGDSGGGGRGEEEQGEHC